MRADLFFQVPRREAQDLRTARQLPRHAGSTQRTHSSRMSHLVPPHVVDRSREDGKLADSLRSIGTRLVLCMLSRSLRSLRLANSADLLEEKIKPTVEAKEDIWVAQASYRPPFEVWGMKRRQMLLMIVLMIVLVKEEWCGWMLRENEWHLLDRCHQAPTVSNRHHCTAHQQ